MALRASPCATQPIGATRSCAPASHIQYPSHLIGKLVQVALQRAGIPPHRCGLAHLAMAAASVITSTFGTWPAHLLAVEKFDEVIAGGRETDADYANQPGHGKRRYREGICGRV